MRKSVKKLKMDLGITKLAIIFVASVTTKVYSFDQMQFLHKGCFKDEIAQPDLPYQATTSASKDISSCVNECATKYFMFAGLQNGEVRYWLMYYKRKRNITNV